MWDLLKQTDIEQAKEDLKLRRAEILKRHAEELKELDDDQVQIDTLDRLASAFARKFKNGAAGSPEPAAAGPEAEAEPHAEAEPEPEPEPAIPSGNRSARSTAEPAEPQPRDFSGTNFDHFSRAVSKSAF